MKQLVAFCLFVLALTSGALAPPPDARGLPACSGDSATVAAPLMEVAPDMNQARVPPYANRAQDMSTLRQGFAQPPREAGPWVYWSWWNNVVSRQEIARDIVHLCQGPAIGPAR